MNKDQVYQLIRENIYACKTTSIEVENAKFHHNIPYAKVSSALKHGLLSLKEEYRLRGETLTSKEKMKYSREGGHINGIDEISLASTANDIVVYEDEIIYDPFSSVDVDIVISSFIKAYRITEHYVNEFLTERKVSTEDFKSIDFRLLNYIKKCTSLEQLKKAIQYYNYICEIASTMVELGLDIPLREMSEEEVTLDKEKVMKLPRIKLK